MKIPLQIRHFLPQGSIWRDLKTFLIAITLILAFGWVLHGPSGRDDVYKTYWPAFTLSSQGSIVNYNGEDLEQSSSLLQVIVLGALHRISGFDLAFLGLCVSIFWGALSVVFTQRIFRGLGLSNIGYSYLGAIIPGLVYWSWSGMETSFAVTCSAWFLAELVQAQGLKRDIRLFMAVMAMLLVRPEFGMVMAMTSLLVLGTQKREGSQRFIFQRGALIAGASSFVGMMILMAVRFGWTGELFPQPVVAKAGQFDAHQVWRGGGYVLHLVKEQPYWAVIGLGGLMWAIRYFRGYYHAGVRIPILFSLSVLVVVILSGGDWMENGRMLLPALPGGIVVLAAVIDEMNPLQRALSVILLSGSLLWGGYGLVNHGSTGAPVWEREIVNVEAFHPVEGMNRVHARDFKMIQELRMQVDLHWERHGEMPVILSQQVGMVMFHLGQTHFGKFRFIDLVGLCSSDFTDCEYTRKRGSGVGGVNMDLYYLMADIDNLNLKCGFNLPDIIFDLDNSERRKETRLMDSGYEIVWRDEGKMGQGELGIEIGKGQFLAVRTGMAP